MHAIIDFYSCDLTGVLRVSEIQVGNEEEIAKVKFICIYCCIIDVVLGASVAFVYGG